MIKKLSNDVHNMLAKTINIIKVIFHKIIEFFKNFILIFKNIFLKEYLKRKECKKFLGKTVCNLFQASFLNPDLKKRKEGQLATNFKQGDSLKNIIQRLDKDLNRRRPPIFTSKAFPVVIKNIKKYICLLISESINVSERGSGDNVTKNNVEQAANFVSATKRQYKYVAVIGGALFGGALGGFLRIVIEWQVPSITIILVLAGLSVVGVWMIVKG